MATYAQTNPIRYISVVLTAFICPVILTWAKIYTSTIHAVIRGSKNFTYPVVKASITNIFTLPSEVVYPASFRKLLPLTRIFWFVCFPPERISSSLQTFLVTKVATLIRTISRSLHTSLYNGKRIPTFFTYFNHTLMIPDIIYKRY